MIAEKILSQVDSEVHHYQVLKYISYHSAYGSTLKRKYVFIRSHIRKLHTKKTTRGWELEVEWKDITFSWIPLKDLKASNPVELAG